MNVTPAWIPLEKFESALAVEPAFVVLLLAIGSFLMYKIFLRDVTLDRHRNLRNLFKGLLYNTAIAAVAYALFWALEAAPHAFARLIPYVGLIAVFGLANVFVRTCRILLFGYLFLKSMKVGVPLLLVNLLTLLLWFLLGAYFITQFLGVNLGPLLATSAILSVVLGLALQDTLGNLFAGISLQIDKTFSIGDWLEVYGTQKYVGQVYEISWRATILISLTEEHITIPNRLMAQSQISNYSIKGKPFIRAQVLRVPFQADLELLRATLKNSALESKAVRSVPEPLVLFTETTESWITAKLVYYIDDYGSQVTIANNLLTRVLADLRAQGFKLATNQLEVSRTEDLSLT